MMNQEQVFGVLRALIPVLAAVLTSLGLDDTTSGLIAGAFVAVAMAAWSYMSNRQSTTVANAAKIQGVTVTVDGSASTAIKAEADRNPNVNVSSHAGPNST